MFSESIGKFLVSLFNFSFQFRSALHWLGSILPGWDLASHDQFLFKCIHRWAWPQKSSKWVKRKFLFLARCILRSVLRPQKARRRSVWAALLRQMDCVLVQWFQPTCLSILSLPVLLASGMSQFPLGSYGFLCLSVWHANTDGAFGWMWWQQQPMPGKEKVLKGLEMVSFDTIRRDRVPWKLIYIAFASHFSRVKYIISLYEPCLT